MFKSILIFLITFLPAAQADLPSSSPNPNKIVATKHHSKKLLSESQLRKNAAKLPAAADKLMGVKAEELMPTWSTTTPPEVVGSTVIAEGKLNLKHQENVKQHETANDQHLQSSHSNK